LPIADPREDRHFTGIRARFEIEDGEFGRCSKSRNFSESRTLSTRCGHALILNNQRDGVSPSNQLGPRDGDKERGIKRSEKHLASRNRAAENP
jgi:hypothetical protein